MSNKIDPIHHGIVDKSDQKVSESRRGATVQPGGSAGSGKSTGKTTSVDTVILTERSQLFERLEVIAAKLPSIDRRALKPSRPTLPMANIRSTWTISQIFCCALNRN